MDGQEKFPVLKKGYILAALGLLGVVFYLALQANSFYVYSGRILTGVYIGNINLSGLNRQQAAIKLLSKQKQLAPKEIVLACIKGEKKIPFQELEAAINIPKTIDKAMSVGRRGSIWQQWQERRKVALRGSKVVPILLVNEKKLISVIDNLTGDMQKNAEDARFVTDSAERLQIIPEKSGLKVDLKETLNQLTMLVAEDAAARIILKFEEVKPQVTAADLKITGIDSLLSGYSTNFDSGAVNRVYNINVAADAIDDMLVKPGEIVSFNKVVGPRDALAGYKQAPVIVNNEIVDGIGGGICQVSSTLYNSVLLANLEIVERTNHSLPVGYVPLGRDATVDFGHLDFRFKNNTEKYLLIKTKVQGDSLTIKIFSHNSLKKEVEIETVLSKVLDYKILYEDDNGLEEGKEIVKQEGKRGYQVNAYRITRENGQLTAREELPMSVYTPQDRIVAVGKKILSSTILPKQFYPDN